MLTKNKNKWAGNILIVFEVNYILFVENGHRQGLEIIVL